MASSAKAPIFGYDLVLHGHENLRKFAAEESIDGVVALFVKPEDEEFIATRVPKVNISARLSHHLCPAVTNDDFVFEIKTGSWDNFAASLFFV